MAEFLKITWEKVLLFILLVLCVLLCVLLSRNIFGRNSSVKIQQKTTADLISTKELSALSASEFVYNGIAQTYKDNGEHDYNVIYKSTVKVSVDAESIEYTIDEEEKCVTFIFPELTIEKPVIDIGSISTIPNRNDLYIDDAIKLCRNDALSKVKMSDRLISSAQENLKLLLEAWFAPVLEGYSYEFVFRTSEGGETN